MSRANNLPITNQLAVRRSREAGSARLRIGIIILAIISVVVLAYPFVKGWSWAVHPKSTVAPHVIPENSASPDQAGAKLTNERRVLIPAIGVDSPIVEGVDESALDRGAWHIPGTSTPDRGGNTVISGHRFRYLPPNNTTFYLLNKLRSGDLIQIQWDNQLYHYRVTDTREVEPTQVEILQNTTDTRLTLFTCTPILSTARRLVITAQLEEVSDGV
jgi:sortase A